ncbi:DUF5339 domain-containing protein [Providencia sneebia]|uniref:Lipoprotein n=1 Tax=Providencia sneebia DSM 19967 TaxID=1141660 RepID=K8WD86_9GAMM|nr:DUF5339 domain-containing protein [Providencia sneebia]EKT58529.1 hypothetical protein OO7_07424 [Providencia sneebia DSM 19967]
MKKMILTCSAALLILSLTACNDDEKQSNTTNPTETCKTYFTEVDALIAKASADLKTKTQLDILSAQLEEGKKQVAALPQEQQDKACQQALDAMSKLKSDITQ